MKADDRILSAATKAKGCPFQGPPAYRSPGRTLRRPVPLRRAFSRTEGSNPSSSRVSQARTAIGPPELCFSTAAGSPQALRAESRANSVDAAQRSLNSTPPFALLSAGPDVLWRWPDGRVHNPF
jgi:hypothetical protein